MPSARATMPSPCSRISRISSEPGRRLVAEAGPAGRRYQRRADRIDSGGEAYDWTLNQPFSPQASPMRPTSGASAGQPASAMSATRPRAASGRRGRRSRRLRLLDQAADGGRHLGAVTGPVLDPIEGDPQRLLGARGDRVVEADALDEAPVAAQPRVGDDDVEEGALLRPATCKPDHDHVDSFEVGTRPAKNRAL